MGFERRPKRPADVEAARLANDKEKLSAFGKAGAAAKAKTREEWQIHAELTREMHESSMQQAAKERRDEELPADD